MAEVQMDTGGDDREPVGYIGTVRRENWDEPERAIFHSRDGNKLYVRGADPCDPDSGRIPMYEGDEVIALEHIAYVGHHTTKEGTDGFVLSQRVVPIREEPGKLFARTLRYGEHDDGRRCHVLPGTTFVLEDLVIELDYVDEWEGQGVEGYVPLTPVLFSWMSFGTSFPDEFRRYLLAAARRLDQAQSLFVRVDELRQSDPEGAPAVRRAVFELIGAIELAVVSLSRAVDMCVDAGSSIGTTAAVPPDISTRQRAVKEIRNAYEHIEDRALGNIRNVPHPDALTIFDYGRIVEDGVITYRTYELSLDSDVPAIIASTRQFLKDVAGTNPLAGTAPAQAPSPQGP